MVLIAVWPERLIGTLQGPEYVAASSVVLPIAVARLLGHVTHMLALVGAATNDFRFLWVYAPALAMQILLLMLYRASLVELGWALVAGHGAVLVVVLGWLVARWRRRARMNDRVVSA